MIILKIILNDDMIELHYVQAGTLARLGLVLAHYLHLILLAAQLCPLIGPKYGPVGSPDVGPDCIIPKHIIIVIIIM